MTDHRFNVLLLDRVAKMQSVLGSKAKEYATGDDRLHNFKRSATEFGGTPAQNLWGFLKKHLTSVLDLVDGSKPVTKAMVDEKVGDAINYLVLLEAVLLEDVK